MVAMCLVLFVSATAVVLIVCESTAVIGLGCISYVAAMVCFWFS